MTTSLRVLTYNVQMRSWGMEVGAQHSLTPYTSVEERAKTIAARILASPQQYDVVCLQEVFDEDGRDVLFEALHVAYPHCIKKSDADGISVVTEIAFGVAAFSATIPGGAALAIVAGAIGALGLAFGSNKFEDVRMGRTRRGTSTRASSGCSTGPTGRAPSPSSTMATATHQKSWSCLSRRRFNSKRDW
jgi:hypothetical protein